MASSKTIYLGQSAPEGVIRVGKSYQAILPQLGELSCKVETNQLWVPNPQIPEECILRFLKYAKETYEYNEEQALGLLYWHGYDMKKAFVDMANFRPLRDEWRHDDKTVFHQALHVHGKNFRKIREMLPDKTIPQLVEHYYDWKRTRQRASSMQNSASANNANGSNSTSRESEDSEPEVIEIKKRIIDKCSNCDAACHTDLHQTPNGVLCTVCFVYWRKMKNLHSELTDRIETRPGQTRHGHMKASSRPPNGIYMNTSAWKELATMPFGAANRMLVDLDEKIDKAKFEVDTGQSQLDTTKKAIADVSNYRPPRTVEQLNATFTNDEILLAVQGISRYGLNFAAIAEAIGTKSESHVREFFYQFRKRYNLDALVADFQRANGHDGSRAESFLASCVSKANSNTKAQQPPKPDNATEDEDDIQIVEIISHQEQQALPVTS